GVGADTQRGGIFIEGPARTVDGGRTRVHEPAYPGRKARFSDRCGAPGVHLAHPRWMFEAHRSTHDPGEMNHGVDVAQCVADHTRVENIALDELVAAALRQI